MNYPYAFLFFFKYQPINLRNNIIGAIINAFTLSELVHVSIAFDDVVLDPRIDGNQYWVLEEYLNRMDIKWIVVLPVTKCIDLDRHTHGVGVYKKYWPTFWRWLFDGYVVCYDCVQITIDLLREGGHDVPEMVSAKQLMRWCDGQGFQRIRA